jgi:hypothetical protein
MLSSFSSREYIEAMPDNSCFPQGNHRVELRRASHARSLLGKSATKGKSRGATWPEWAAGSYRGNGSGNRMRLFVAQRNERIDVHRPDGRDVAGREGHSCEHKGDSQEGERIGGPHAVEQPCHQVRRD